MADSRGIGDLYGRVFDAAPLGAVLLDGDKIALANSAFRTTFELPPAHNLKGKALLEVIHPEDPETCRAHMASAAEGPGPIAPYETDCLPPGGGRKRIRAFFATLALEGKQPHLMVFFEDVTQLRLARQELEENRRKFKTLFEQLSSAVFLADAETGRILETNRQAELLLGRPREEIVGMHQKDLHPPGEAEWYGKIFAEHVGAGEGTALSAEVVRSDGKRVPVMIRASTFVLGESRLILGLFEDITELKAAEAAFKESEKRYQEMVDDLGEGIGVVDEKEQITFANPAFHAILGVAPGTLVGRNFKDFLEPGEVDRVLLQTGRRRRGLRDRYEVALVRPDGERRIIKVTASPHFDKEGNYRGASGILSDITEHKRARVALEESEERYRGLVRDLGEGVGVVDEEERFTFANPACHAIFGVEPGTLVGRNLKEFMEPGEMERVLSQTTRRKRGLRDRYEITLVRPDGERRILQVTASPRFDEEGNYRGANGILSDITERKLAQVALEESEIRFRTLAETTEAAILIYQGDSLVFTNRGARAMTGFSFEEIKGKKFWEFVHPDHREMVKARGVARQRGDEVPRHYEFKILTKDGRAKWVDFSAGAIKYRGSPAGVVTAIDITERKVAEEALKERQRQLEAILASSRAMGGFLNLRETGEIICRCALEAFNARMAWIGLVVPESTEVKVLASAGHDEGYTEKVRLTWDESAWGRGPMGTAIKTREPCVQSVFDPSFALWREEAEARGYRTICALPLVHGETVRGAIALYDGRDGAFGPESFEILDIFARHATLTVVSASLYAEAMATIRDLQSSEERSTRRYESLRLSREALARSEERFQAVTEFTNDVIWETDENLVYTYLNPVVEKISGYSADEILGTPQINTLPMEERTRLAPTFERMRLEPAPFGPLETKIMDKAGRERLLEALGTPMWDAENRFKGYRGMIREITERKRTETLLEAHAARYRGLMEGAEGILLTWNEQLEVTSWNDYASRAFGYDREEILGRNLLETIVPPMETGGRSLESMLKAVFSDPNRHATNFNENVTKNGRRIWVAWVNRPLLDVEGRVQEVVSFGVDLTGFRERG